MQPSSSGCLEDGDAVVDRGRDSCAVGRKSRVVAQAARHGNRPLRPARIRVENADHAERADREMPAVA